MKKIISIILILALTFSLAACGGKETPEAPKEYTMDFDKLSESLFNVTVEGDRNAFENITVVTKDNYDELVGDIVDSSLIKDFIVFMPNDDFSTDVFFAFQTDKSDEINGIMTEYFNKFKEERWISDDQISIFAESGWYVWSVSKDKKAVIEVVKRGMETSVMQSELLAIKESIPVFAANMPMTLEDEFFLFEGTLDKANLEEMFVLAATIIGVNPIMVFKPVEGGEEAVKTAMEEWKATQLSTMEWYQPHLVPIINSMELVEENGYMIYIVNEYPDVTKAAIKSAWVEVTAE